MRVVHHNQRGVFLGEFAYRLQLGNVAIHREDAVCCDQAMAGLPSFLKPCFEILHITVAVTEFGRFRESNAVDDTGMVQLVRDDGVLGL